MLFKVFLRSLLLAITFFVVGCATEEESVLSPKSRVSLPDGDYIPVNVFYATDRNIIHNNNTDIIKYGHEHTSLSYGQCIVSIPREHRMGELETPFLKQWDPEEHVTLLHTSLIDKSDYYEVLKNRIDDTSEKKALLFVHGFNVSFENAARRTAQMAYDLGFDGVPTFYSWPSQGPYSAFMLKKGYEKDEKSIVISQANFERFLREFTQRTEAERIYLIAHSMGNRMLTEAICKVAKDNPAIRNKFKEIILAAPDINAEVFIRDIAPNIISEEETSVTLYASSEDRALEIAALIYDDIRIGDTSNGVPVINGIDTIDATGVATDFLKHSYVGDSESILSDIFYITGECKLRPSRRFGLMPKFDENEQCYWTFKKK
ncbi:MAG: alpha/beta hydrolase [Planctomycetota bacterium]|jgi:esterase/lipase superfamily enzyme